MRKEQVISTTNNNQMEEKGMKSRFIHLKKRFVPALSGALMGRDACAVGRCAAAIQSAAD